MKKLFLSFITILSVGIGLARAYQTYTINGIPYLFPDVNDETWGQHVTDWAGAVTNGMLQKAGGTFTLTSEAYFGANYGIRAAYFKSKNVPAASTGTIRLAYIDTIRWRNINNTGDFSFGVNSSSLPVFNGYVLGYSTDLINVIFLATSALQSNIDAVYTNVASTYTSLIAAINSTNTYSINQFANVALSTANITSRADAVAIATTAIDSHLTALDSSTASLTTNLRTSTTAITTRADAAAISSTTANARLNSLDLSTAAITTRADAVAVTTSANTTRLNNLDTSTANITTRADAVAIATTSASVQKITVYSAGVFAGNVSTINFNTNLTVSVVGGTATISATGGAGVSTIPFVYGLLISSVGADTNTLQSTISYINIMGDQYFNVTTMTALNKNGAGGLDTGAEASSTWYAIWAISNGTQMSLLLSLDTNAFPALPAGYTKWYQKPIGYVYNNGSSNIVPFCKIGNRVNIFQANGSDALMINIAASPATSLTDIDLTPFVSKTCRMIFYRIHIYGAASGSWNFSAKEKGSQPNWDTASFPNFANNNASTAGGRYLGTDLVLQTFHNPRSIQYITDGLGASGQVYGYLKSYEEE